MAVLDAIEEEFSRRLEQIPPHGLGLSVDVYSPDLLSLLGVLRERQVLPSYLEVFQRRRSRTKHFEIGREDLTFTKHSKQAKRVR